MKMTFVLSASLLIGGALLQAQQPPLDQNRPLFIPLVSPDVHADRTITFRFSAPNAPAIQLTFDGKNYPMTKDDKGVWSATVGPLDPNVYRYSYQIGGVQFNSGQVEIRSPSGTVPVVYATRNVPHGTIAIHSYYSNVQGRPRTLRVYLPPQYYSEPNRKFPVLYLFSGGDETGFSTTGRGNLIMDNLIADGKAAPMLVITPNNSINDGTGKDAAYPAALDNLAVIEKEMLADIMPMIEKDYRTYNDRDHRAITGASFGGGVSFGMGMRHLDMFAYVGEFSTGTFGGADTPPDGHTNYIAYDPDKIAPGMYKHLLDPATKPKLFFMAVGDRDPRSPYQKLAYEDFKRNGIDVTFKTFPGGHGDQAFGGAQVDFVQLLFK